MVTVYVNIFARLAGDNSAPAPRPPTSEPSTTAAPPSTTGTAGTVAKFGQVRYPVFYDYLIKNT